MIERELFDKGIAPVKDIEKKIIDFLKQNKDFAFNTQEISEALGIARWNVSRYLRMLIEKGQVETKDRHWIYKKEIQNIEDKTDAI